MVLVLVLVVSAFATLFVWNASIVAGLNRATPTQRADLLGRLCNSDAADARGWLATSMAHERAHDALESLCNG